MADDTTTSKSAKSVTGKPLEKCCDNPKTGFYRDGFCHTGPSDSGSHVVAATMTEEFLQYTKAQGNDLSTPRPEFDFPGLKAGDRWCLCAMRWKQADDAGVAPPVHLEATHEKALDMIPEAQLKKRAVQ